jgi:hypothetical protein
MKSPGHATADDGAVLQLAAEQDWLTGRDLPESLRANPTEPEIDKRVLAILSDARLACFLRIIERHNSQPRDIPGRRLPQRDHFLLARELRRVLLSIQVDNEKRQRYPVLDQPAAEVRNHLQRVASDCRTLAELIRKGGPQPGIALAGPIGRNEVLRALSTYEEVFEASEDLKYQEVRFADLLDRAGDWFGALRVQPSGQNRRPSAKVAKAERAELRVRAAKWLPGVFKKRLGHFYDAYVATIATVVSGCETDEEFVKTVRKRRAKSEQLKGQSQAKNERNCPVC